MKSTIRTQSGFTLVELVLVILIIGILAAIGAVKFMDLSSAAKIAQCKNNQQHLITAQRLYWIHASVYDGKGQYASDIDDLAPFLASGQIPECPENGTYQIISDLVIECTVAEHKI